jgi:hypothetical protein
MKNTAMFLVVITSVFLVIFTVFSQLDISLRIMNALFLAGNGLVLLMVYKVLTDKYSTSKTFKDWYEDHPKQSN